MKRQPARVVEPADVRRLLELTTTQRHPSRNKVMVLLSFKAGLRACEIAGLTWSMVLQSDQKVGGHLTVSRAIAKCGSGRLIPMHDELRNALRQHHRNAGKPNVGPVLRSERGGHLTARSVVNWFDNAYAQLALYGCSSHSGRRTFITQSARMISKIGGSLRDVQELAGHRALTTTERYIVGDRQTQRKLIRLL
ncbi:MAG: integrase [Sphingobium sp.]|nr:integrase [Sphingobium sp.]|tara:strand:+ start:6540 stop:7121 length:582 start_codon:yes stop_codon:yes gene_type:complete